ncbi:uncharacterized protein LY89DRAFT_608352 [Mollisia scopiformis]|uniref:Transcription initiation factor TFIID subunit 4 n=1 Tax=Mollisia scopiformis TaxID=149040 RepID=A0A194XP14_MOLSC|nr:uncharacterized protein LY89DRAFT_608352 [Mollisia scopiformis]KUJ21819.1 hypothetical protein LY89DRAFT_608352 [Mollisia scopiformis]
MAQPQQQQYPMPSAFSPPPGSSPTTTQQYPVPPSKRQRLSPIPSSQPGSPYVQSPYMMSPNTSTTSASASPHFTNVQLPNVYNTPYSNGHTTSPMTLTLPQSNHQHPQQLQHQNSMNFNANQPSQQSTYNNFAPPMATPQGTGTMGPPSKPVEKEKEDGIDVMDVLGGTGVNLREEEQYTFQMYNSSFNSQLSGSQSGTISSGHSYTQFPPGDEASFYGAGPANAAGERANVKDQDEFHKKAADKAWHDAAHNLAVSRQKELNNPFLQVHQLQKKMEKMTREHGLALNMDTKGTMGYFKVPNQFPLKEVRVSTTMGPDAAFVSTSGGFIPADSMLVDQVALLSIATKHRLRGLVEDAAKLAKARQTGSHGIVPEEWADVAVPSDLASSTVASEGGPRYGWESAVSPHSNPRKRSFSAANKSATPITGSKITNEVVAALRAEALKERDFEEARLRKRSEQAGGGAQRQASVVPGTPGSIAPEVIEKAPTKKEQKKKAEAKVNEALTHTSANTTASQFLGGRGMFGKTKKYSWMTPGAGGSASGASTPGRINTQGLPGTPGGGGPPPVEKYTVDGVRRLGQWREDKEKGRDIQMRDWISVLEADGRAKKTLQKAYLHLDHSDPK